MKIIIKNLNMDSIFIFLFLILFPFGQIIRIGIIHPIDIVVGMAGIYAIFRKLPSPESFKYLQNIILVFTASWIFSVFLLNDAKIIYGGLYLLRFIAYIYFFIYVWNFAKKSKKLLVDSLLYVSIASAVLGWLQFFLVPDLKPLFALGWDMHLFRLAGTFLDPGYLGLIIVFGLLIAITRAFEVKNKKYYLITLFLFVSLAFTYSRASYLAFLFGIFSIAIYKRAIKHFIVFSIALGVLALMLPTSKNKSIEIFRSFSAIARIENYKETVQIFTKSPALGVGYNNICLSYNKFIGFKNFSSHACSGSDSSILLILATTGVVGLLIFIYSTSHAYMAIPKGKYKTLLLIATISLVVHSLFSNSLFYSWILGYLIILLAVAEA